MDITATTTNVENFKAARSFNRTSRALFLALCSYLDHATLATDAQKERAKNALANVGAKMLASKNALPSDPSKLRMHVESIKQKAEAIAARISDVKTFANVAQAAAIRKEVSAAIDNVKLFLAEYNEHKAAVVAAKAA